MLIQESVGPIRKRLVVSGRVIDLKTFRPDVANQVRKVGRLVLVGWVVKIVQSSGSARKTDAFAARKSHEQLPLHLESAEHRVDGSWSIVAVLEIVSRNDSVKAIPEFADLLGESFRSGDYVVIRQVWLCLVVIANINTRIHTIPERPLGDER